MLLISGGVSMGEFDIVEDVLRKLGCRLLFDKVAVQPGKPLGFGTVDGIPFFGLPGNPVSVFVSFEQFMRPLCAECFAQPLGLDAEAGDPCGECGAYACDVSGGLRCDDPGLNACGGCGTLDNAPGESCGDGGVYESWFYVFGDKVDLNGEKGELSRTETRIQALLDAVR